MEQKRQNLYLFDTIIIFIICFILFLLIKSPAFYAKVFIDGLSLFSSSVLPGLFPFMFFTRILVSLDAIKKASTLMHRPMKKLFNSPGISSFVMFISLISGYPIGAKLTADLYENKVITLEDAKKTLTYSLTSGPIFVIGTVGAIILSNTKAGIIIFISHIISNFITGFILTRKKTTKQQPKPQNSINTYNINKIISQSMESSIHSILIVGGFITVFYCIIEIVLSLKITKFILLPFEFIFSRIGVEPQISRGLMSGIVEVTRGIKELSIYFNSSPQLVSSIICSLISFSGLSIILQSSSMLEKTTIQTRHLVLTKFMHAIFAFPICMILSSLFL